MNWIKQLNEAIEYIDNNLDKEISYDTISKIAGCSIYNFQRMFSYIAGKPLSEYIRCRKLTLAAFDIINGRGRIIDIALKYGYESQDSFARAFRTFHGVLPSAIKKEVVNLKSCPKLSFQITIRGAETMDYKIEKIPSFSVIGVSNKMLTEESFKLVPQIWEKAWKDGIMDTFCKVYPEYNYRPSGFLGIADCGDYGKAKEMNYILGITNYVYGLGNEKGVVPEGMQEFTYQEATWVIINADGKLPEAVQNVYKKFYSEWLPSSGYNLEDLPVIECYPDENHQEVWIAVKKDK
ncbi:MAG: AraC family transcriptional regulator [Clostridiales bacterium]|nr:AraC family transcriptional regulator [Clostridiales bacterium]